MLDSAYVGQHPQVWKLREYVYTGQSAVPDGDPLNGHLPREATITEAPTGLEIALPPLADEPAPRRWVYRPYDPIVDVHAHVADIIVIGEGHSSWGRFVLRGRVRPFDGLITLVKQYAHRGLWLYRGFVVGGRDGHFVGRWRDTETDVDRHGYEGCFVLGRRSEN